MKLSPRLKGFLWFVTSMLYLTAGFSVTFYLTRWMYTLIGLTPPALLIQVVNSLGGLVLTGLSIRVLFRLFRSRVVAGQMRVFGPIIEALQRVAQGDFSVRVDNILDRHSQNDGVISELVNNVNHMALELRQMEAMRQEFISNVSHEIQSPLTSIQGFARALQNDHLTPKERCHYLSIIETESTRLSRITDNLLRLASLEAKHVKFEPKPYRLDRQIRSLILACEPQWAAKEIDMDVSLDELEITADEDLLSQVWINLIANSIKFTPAHGRIGIALQRRGRSLVFKITDTGIGISEEDQAHIFERFYKADKSRTRSSDGGSGLGLSIAQKIVAMHAGTIAVESRLGAGTTFAVSLLDKGHLMRVSVGEKGRAEWPTEVDIPPIT
jgi:two-component system phosphate regulon sensor histidine kinase PhoR